MAKFSGFSSACLKFFRELEKNNDREWFGKRKELYEEVVRRPMVELVGLMGEGLRKAGAAEYVPDRPDKAMYRIYRDTRFSKDKTPYKTHVGVHFQHRREWNILEHSPSLFHSTRTHHTPET